MTLGGVHRARVTGGPTTGQGFIGLGFSKAAWGAISLPMDLTVLGMPGCFLNASFDVKLPILFSAGMAQWPIDLRAAKASWLGLRFYAQAFAVEPKANVLGVTASNGIQALIGWN